MAITAVEAKSARPKDRPYKLADAHGLHLLVNPNGKRIWQVRFRLPDTGKETMRNLGGFPDLSLQQARERRDEIRKGLREKVVPASATRSTRSFGEIADEWVAKSKNGWSESYTANIERRIAVDLKPTLGARAINAVTRAEIMDTLAVMEQRGAVETAHRVRRYAELIFDYAMVMNLVTDNPVAGTVKGLARPAKVKHRARIRPNEMVEFYRRLAVEPLEAVTALAMRWTILTWSRTGETRFAPREGEIEGLDGPEPVWRIPGKRMKREIEHIVPLSRQAVELLPAIRAASSGPLLFNGATGQPISENTMLYGLYRMGYHSRATMHGFRGTASTWANEQVRDEVRQYDSDWIERQLAHVEEDEVRAAYNAAEWLPQRRRMMQGWADFLGRQERLAEAI